MTERILFANFKVRCVCGRTGLVLCAALGISFRAAAFTLLGPFADWMDLEKSYRLPMDLGGPMNITEGYRWNVPVVSYGFERSFVDYFGSNGVAAVESAIALLNAVPPASSINLQDYPYEAWRNNLRAEQWSLVDLKSQTAALLLEQLGLTDSTRYTFCIRDFYLISPGVYGFDVTKRNFDPFTATLTPYVNGILYSYEVWQDRQPPDPSRPFCDAGEFPVDPVSSTGGPVTSFYARSPYGLFITNLTRDDVGGLRFLLNASQVRVESLLPDVQPVGTNTAAFVRTAARPGIEKVTFMRHPAGTLNGQFLPFTNRWTDLYFDLDAPAWQEVERVTTRPDIVFTAGDIGPDRQWLRTGTTNWANCADLNGNPGGTGPGVIQPPITITYNDGGPFWFLTSSLDTNSFPTELDAVLVYAWASFDSTTNAPVIYPNIQVSFMPTVVYLRLLTSGTTRQLQWPLAGPPYARFAFQTATNFDNWNTLATVTNTGTGFNYDFQIVPSEAARFFRTTPVP